MKKIISYLCLVCLMVSMMSVSVFAADSVVTLTGTDGDTYEAYMVFSATSVEVAGVEKIGYTLNPDFADFFTPAKLGTYSSAVDYVAAQTDASAAAQLAESLMNYVIDKNLTPADTGTDTLDLNKGYYLIIEKENIVGARSLAMLEVTTKSHTVAVKSSTPTLTLKVLDDDTDSYIDIADTSINETLKFKLTGTVTNMKGYTSYTYTIHNALEAGMSLDSIESVKYYNGSSEEITPAGVTYTLDDNGDGTFDIIFTGMKNAVTSEASTSVATVEVIYTVEYTDDFVYGNNGNLASAYLTYSNDPYNVGSTEDTVGDNVIAYSYTLDILKEDALTSDKLAGATFTLYSDSSATIPVYLVALTAPNSYKVVTSDVPGAITEITTDDAGALYIEGLDATTYYLKENSAPIGYNPLLGILDITITASYKSLDNNFALADRTALATISSNYQTTDTGAEITVENSVGGTLP